MLNKILRNDIDQQQSSPTLTAAEENILPVSFLVQA